MPRKQWSEVDRRRVLKSTGIAGAAVGMGAFAGCLGDDDDNGNGEGDLDEVDARTDEELEEVDYDEIEEGGILRTALAENINDFDPVESGDTTSSMASQFLIYEAMVHPDRDGDNVPWVATDWEVETQDIYVDDYEEYAVDPDDAGQVLFEMDDGSVVDVDGGEEAAGDDHWGMRVTYELRDDVVFHNGEELTAENVVASYDRYEGSTRGPTDLYDWYLYAEADGDYTVDVYFQQPDADGIGAAGSIAIVPEEHFDVAPGDIDPLNGEDPIGSGFFQFEEFDDESFYSVSRFDDHWFSTDAVDWWDGSDDFPDQPPIEGIEFEIVPSDSTRASAIQSQEIHHTSGLEADILTDLDEDDDYQVRRTVAGGYDFLQYPVTHEPWTDPRIREGVNHLIPRPSIVENIYQGWAIPATLPMSPVAADEGTHDYEALEEEYGEYNEYDPERAEELVQEVFDDHDIEAPMEIEMWTNADSDDRVRWNELIIESLESTGLFEVEFEEYEWGQYIEMLNDPEMHQEEDALVSIGLSSGFSPDGFFRSMVDPSLIGTCCNHTGYDNPEVFDLLQATRFDEDVVGEENIDTRRDRVEELIAAILEEPPVSWIQYGLEDDVIIEDSVHGWNTWPINSEKYSRAIFHPPAEQTIYISEEV
ncbi:ABC transporter substrate-binding protein [Natronolimnobius sp. AArcel1]|uniref:ABC transporter substrate-binding protein n=1 Tax=Natronolimnobius sp. AArcel1 TaxID=1679093 RepID=UPI0013ED8978|nr:ABC transporter substrate-binding protein [Natronolimnobius sp. AArcel1]NGM69758.1 ABC transporter substrate-binding protein [Natronolimnobius sp. AArcel1]